MWNSQEAAGEGVSLNASEAPERTAWGRKGKPTAGVASAHSRAIKPGGGGFGAEMSWYSGTLGLYDCYSMEGAKHKVELCRYSLWQSSIRTVHLCLSSILFMEMIIGFLWDAVYSTPILG